MDMPDMTEEELAQHIEDLKKLVEYAIRERHVTKASTKGEHSFTFRIVEGDDEVSKEMFVLAEGNAR